MNFWPNVQKRMSERKLTAKALAELAGVTAPALTGYSKGAIPRLDIASRIAEVLGASLDELVWGTGEEASRPLCPNFDEHALLHELTEELGMKEFIALTRMGNQTATWKIADLLVKHYPKRVSVQELQQWLGLSVDVLKSSLLALRRRGLVDESGANDTPTYGLHKYLTPFSARDMGDLTQHIKRALKILLMEVLPALERNDKTGHLVTLSARLPAERAEALAHRLNDIIKREVAECMDPEEGDTSIYVSFGVAFRQE